MVVSVIGRRADGKTLCRNWRLLVEYGDGPFVPAIPARILIAKIAAGDIEAGARPALGAFNRSEAEAALSRIKATISTDEETLTPLFQTALGPDWERLPPEQRAMHEVFGVSRSDGQSKVIRGRSVLSRIIGALFRFPPAGDAVPLTVTMERRGSDEIWVRKFGNRSFRSRLSSDREGALFERFGPFTFRLALPIGENGLEMPVTDGWCLGVPIPKALLPRSDTLEYVKDGLFHFDVALSAPLVGDIVRYQGYLTPARSCQSPAPDVEQTRSPAENPDA
jgi:hypothetical protein